MSDLDDLVLRLRDKDAECEPGAPPIQALCESAADAIDSLRAEVERLTKERDEAREKAKALDDLEKWLRDSRGNKIASLRDESGLVADLFGPSRRDDVEGEGPTLAAAIRAAIEKAGA